jgi:hypothetical protein
MPIRTLIKKIRRPIVLFSLFLSSCGCKENYWCVQELKSPFLKSLRVFHNSSFDDPSPNLEFEIIKNTSSIRAHLNLISEFVIPTEDSQMVEAMIKINNDTPFRFKIKRFCGGQKLLLPSVITRFIIKSLLEKKSVELSFNDYRIKLFPENFDEAWHYIGDLVATPGFF